MKNKTLLIVIISMIAFVSIGLSQNDKLVEVNALTPSSTDKIITNAISGKVSQNIDSIDIIFGSSLFGSYKNGTWNYIYGDNPPSDTKFPQLSDWKDGFRFYDTNNEYIGSGKVKINTDITDGAPDILTSYDFDANNRNFGLIINGTFSPIPNDIKKENPDQFTNLVQKILNEKGYKNAKAKVIEAFSLDFEKNGKTQYIILASSGENDFDKMYNNQLNDETIDETAVSDRVYSIAFLYEGENVTIIDEQYAKKDDFESLSLKGCSIDVYDLNGDGKYEVILCISIWTYGYYVIFKYENGKFMPVMYRNFGI